MRTLAVASLLLLSAVLVVPMAAAEPEPPRCAEKGIAPGVSLNESCGITAEYELMSCPINGSWQEYRVGNHVVRIYTCGPPE